MQKLGVSNDRAMKRYQIKYITHEFWKISKKYRWASYTTGGCDCAMKRYKRENVRHKFWKIFKNNAGRLHRETAGGCELLYINKNKIKIRLFHQILVE